MEIVAVVHPPGHGEHYRFEGLRQSEMAEYASLLPGLPVTIEHDDAMVSGKCTEARVAANGSCVAKMRLDVSDLGREAEYHMDSLGWRSVSASSDLIKTPDG